MLPYLPVGTYAQPSKAAATENSTDGKAAATATGIRNLPGDLRADITAMVAKYDYEDGAICRDNDFLNKLFVTLGSSVANAREFNIELLRAQRNLDSLFSWCNLPEKANINDVSDVYKAYKDELKPEKDTANLTDWHKIYCMVSLPPGETGKTTPYRYFYDDGELYVINIVSTKHGIEATGTGQATSAPVICRYLVRRKIEDLETRLWERLPSFMSMQFYVVNKSGELRTSIKQLYKQLPEDDLLRAKINSLDLSKWDVSNVKIGAAAFSDMTGFQGKGLHTWDLSKLECAAHMFWGCKMFNPDSVENWSLRNVTDATLMFRDCESFTGQGAYEWTLGNLQEARKMFDNCKVFNPGSVAKWMPAKLVTAVSLFKDCTLFTGEGIETWTFISDDDLNEHRSRNFGGIFAGSAVSEDVKTGLRRALLL